MLWIQFAPISKLGVINLLQVCEIRPIPCVCPPPSPGSQASKLISSTIMCDGSTII
jgi:hypothetical protein